MDKGPEKKGKDTLEKGDGCYQVRSPLKPDLSDEIEIPVKGEWINCLNSVSERILRGETTR